MAEFCGGDWEPWQQEWNVHAALNAAAVDNIIHFWIKQKQKLYFGLDTNVAIMCVWILFAINHYISVTWRTITAVIMEFGFIYVCVTRE